MFSVLKRNIGKSALLGAMTITGILMLVNGLIKAIFILSDESAVQKAQVSDVVLGTLSLGLTLLAMLATSGIAYLVFIKRQEFDRKFVIGLFGATALIIIAAIMVVVKDHTSYTGDWAKLNDLAKARADIARNLVVANSLVGDAYGNIGAINPAGTNVTDLALVITSPKLLNTVSIQEYQFFLEQVIQSKKDLAALYAIDELLNKAGEPLIAGRIVDALAAAWQQDHTITVSAWFASTAHTHAYDFLSVLEGYLQVSKDSSNNDVYTKIVGLAGSQEVHKLLSALAKQPIVYTGITSAYLQSFPITVTVIGLAIAAPTVYVVSEFILGKVVR